MNPCACCRAVVVVAVLAPALTACHRGERIIERPPPVRYLLCPQTESVPPFTQDVGPQGAILVFHGDTVVIPAHNVPQNQTWRFTLSRARGDTVGIMIDTEPPAARFSRSATIVINAGRCSSQAWGTGSWSIWRNRRQSIMSELGTNPRRARALIDSASVFMIAN